MKQGAKAKKKEQTIRTVFKVVLFLGMLCFVVVRLMQEDWSKMDAFHLKSPWALFFSVLLVTVNQGIEYIKWKLIAQRLVTDRSILFKSFLGGIASGFVTPNGWGNFLGRIVFFRKRDRMFIVLSTLLTNLSQVLPTILFGALACTVTTKLPYGTAWIVWLTAGGLFLFFFFGEYLFPKRIEKRRWVRHFVLMQQRIGNLRVPLFIWSTIRYQVFSFQYALLFYAFGYTDFQLLLPAIWLIYVLTSFVPSLWSGKVIIRETAAIFVFTGTPVLIPDVVVISLLIWLINLVLPAAISSFVWIPISKEKNDVVD